MCSVCVSALSVVLLQMWVAVLMKDPCSSDEHQAVDTWAYRTTGTVHPEKGRGRISRSRLHHSLCACKVSRSSALRLRRLMVATIMDPLILLGLPSFYGLWETIAAITYAGAVLSCACFTIAIADAGTFAFGSLVASRLLKHKIFVNAEELWHKVHADISADELRWHLVRFLDLPANADSVEMPLPLLTVLRSGICGIEPDSVRVRYFVLLSAACGQWHG